MKRSFMMALVLAAMLVAGGCATGAGGSGKAPVQSLGKVRHVVLFKWNALASAEAIRAIEAKFCSLPAAIPGIAGFEWGTDMSSEKLAQGFTHCFLVTFNDVAARDAYLPHPAHQEFVHLIGPHVEKVLVVDYIARE
jgi:hypothetical protein